MRYCTGKLAFCLVMEVRVRVRICFSLETPTPTKKSPFLSGADLINLTVYSYDDV
jgi:hypothetical protein